MKKIAILAFVLAGLFLQPAALAGQDRALTTVKVITISMNSDGTLVGVMCDSTKIYPLGDTKITCTPPNPAMDLSAIRLAVRDAFPKELNIGTNVVITICNVKEETFKITITRKKSTYELIPIFKGETQPTRVARTKSTQKPPTHNLTSSFILDESGTTYQIKVTKLGADPTKDEDIFTESLQTRARYCLGSHVGIFVPFGPSSEYSLGYSSPTATTQTIMENKLRNVSLIFIGSIYPFGMEPSGELLSCRRIQLNLATELSNLIFKNIYLGLGYDFTFASISLLGRFGATQELQNGFKVGDQLPSSLSSVPTVSRNKWDWGVTICMPMNLIIAWLGKSLGLN